MDMASRRVRELLFEFGLIMAAIVLSKVFDFALGYVAASILAIAFVFQWVIQREEGEREVELQGIFGGPIPWAEIKEPPVRPQINWWTWSFPELEYDHKTGTWVEYGGSGGHKAKGCVIHVTNNVDDQKGKGQQARVRAQISWTYDNGSIGPQFSPAPWIGEELGQIELPVGVMKKLLVAIRSFDGNYWSGHGNTRLDRNHHIQAHSDMLPFSGSMIIRLIDSTDVLIAQQKWSWKEDPYVHWPMIKPL